MVPTREDSSPEQTLETILDAAGECFGRKGFAAARMEEIAGAAGVNKATIYYHLGKKEELYRRVLLNPLTEIREAIENLENGDSPGEQLWFILETVREQSCGYPELFRVLLRAIAGGGDELPRSVRDTIGEILDRFEGMIRRAQDEGVLRPVPPRTVQKFLAGAVLVTAAGDDFFEALSPSEDAAGDHKAGDAAVDLLLHGLFVERGEG